MKTKPYYASKTLWANLLVGLAAVLSFVAGPEFPVQLTAEQLEAVVFVTAVVNGVLRLVTKTRLTSK